MMSGGRKEEVEKIGERFRKGRNLKMDIKELRRKLNKIVKS